MRDEADSSPRRLIDQAARLRFLEALRGGAARGEAAAAGGFPLASFYNVRARDPLFRMAWQWAMELACVDERGGALARPAGPREAGGETIRIVPQKDRLLQRRRMRNVKFTDKRQQNSRLGRQELEGLLLDEFDGALWTRDMLENSRFPLSPSGEKQFERVVIGLDPPASTGGDACGIVVCGRDKDRIVWVLADLSASGLTPEGWARRVAEAAALFGAVRVVAEKNQGGDMIASILRGVDADLPVRLVPAVKSKPARAEPVALRFETGRARLAGRFPALEDQLCALTWSGYQGPGSPDRADAMVWAITDLIERHGEPRIRAL